MASILSKKRLNVVFLISIIHSGIILLQNYFLYNIINKYVHRIILYKLVFICLSTRITYV